MFIPGYALSLVLYPEQNDLPFFSRIALSFVFSIVSVILVVLFIDEVVAMKTTPENIIISIVIFTMIALLIWKTELRIHNMKFNSAFFYRIYEKLKVKLRFIKIKGKNLGKNNNDQTIIKNYNEEPDKKNNDYEFEEIHIIDGNLRGIAPEREQANKKSEEKITFPSLQGESDENHNI